MYTDVPKNQLEKSSINAEFSYRGKLPHSGAPERGSSCWDKPMRGSQPLARIVGDDIIFISASAQTSSSSSPPSSSAPSSSLGIFLHTLHLQYIAN